MKIKHLLMTLTAVAFIQNSAMAKSPSELNDLEIAHVAYVADTIDIRYAHLALAISKDPAIHEFAETMIRDHTAVNGQALALLKKLGASPQNNFLSKQLEKDADRIISEMVALRGKKFDHYYASNELSYHKAVNDLVGNAFIPNIENSEVKSLFKAGYEIFKAHEKHASMMVNQLK